MSEEEQVVTWSLTKTNGVAKPRVRVSILRLIGRQRGSVVTVSKIVKHLRKELGIKARKRDVRDVMLEMGAREVNESKRNPHIFDISKCEG